MYSTISTLMAVGAISGVDAYRNSNPFTGEHADKNIIFHEDGGMTARAERAYGDFNKYGEIISKRDYNVKPMSGYTFAYNTVFGPTPEQLAFEEQHKANKQNHRLQAKQSFRYDDEVFLGNIVMRGDGTWEGKAMVDTATDLNALIGFCQSCDPDSTENRGRFNVWKAADVNKGDISGRNTTVQYGDVEMVGAWAEGTMELNEEGNGLKSSKFEFLYVQK